MVQYFYLQLHNSRYKGASKNRSIYAILPQKYFKRRDNYG